MGIGDGLLGGLEADSVEVQGFPAVRGSIGVVTDLLHIEGFLGHLHEAQICSPTPFVTKVAH